MKTFDCRSISYLDYGCKWCSSVKLYSPDFQYVTSILFKVCPLCSPAGNGVPPGSKCHAVRIGSKCHAVRVGSKCHAVRVGSKCHAVRISVSSLVETVTAQTEMPGKSDFRFLPRGRSPLYLFLFNSRSLGPTRLQVWKMTVFAHFFERLFSYFRYASIYFLIAILNLLSFTRAFSQQGYLGDGKLFSLCTKVRTNIKLGNCRF